MGLFDQILDAVNNPETEASPNQLNSILDTVQQLTANSGANSSEIQSAMSIVGNYTRSALQQQRNSANSSQIGELINQFAGTQANASAVQSLFSQPQLQQIIQQINLKTGLNPQTIHRILPILVPLVLNLLKTGNRKTAYAAKQNNAIGGNSVLQSFLDADGDGDVDVADAMIMASRHLGR